MYQVNNNTYYMAVLGRNYYIRLNIGSYTMLGIIPRSVIHFTTLRWILIKSLANLLESRNQLLNLNSWPSRDASLMKTLLIQCMEPRSTRCFQCAIQVYNYTLCCSDIVILYSLINFQKCVVFF